MTASLLNNVIAAIAAAMIVSVAAVDDAAAQGPQAPPGGQLVCHVQGGFGFIVGSSRSVDCKFTPTDGYPELYAGRINKIGLDLGWKRGGVLAWAVLSPGLTRGPGALAGNYVGATAEVVAGVGAGANALVGGNKVVLNPLSVSAAVGINLAGGIADLDLVYRGQ
jgi:hypothetical protein